MEMIKIFNLRWRGKNFALCSGGSVCAKPAKVLRFYGNKFSKLHIPLIKKSLLNLVEV